MQVVVVESPAKAKTINKYLGKDFTVLASYGHIRDLPSKDGSVRPDEDFALDWEMDGQSKKRVADIAEALRGADGLILATDPDREGEAISWHVLEALRARKVLKDKRIARVTFNAITKEAVQKAMAAPRDIDMELVDAYLARRALDYLVGFNLSPVLWRKLPGSRSAGRVQSVALRLVCEREMEIERFKPQEYWTIEADVKTPRGETALARLTGFEGAKLKRLDIGNQALADRALAAVRSARLKVASVQAQPQRRNPPPPFTTSTLQQEAARKLGFSASRTMQVAQRLYEGVDIGGETIGLITYMRTDGVQMDDGAVRDLRSVIGRDFGDRYVPAAPRRYATKAKNAQEAHEAIRPTDPTRRPGQLRLADDMAKLYDLVWKRAMASQMEAAALERTTIDFADQNGKVEMRSTGQVILFDGFLKLYQEGKDDEEDDENRRLPAMREGESIEVKEARSVQHFTEPPPRFSEASLVKRLEELGIGRPSTYAAILEKLKERNYVRAEKNRFIPDDRGRLVTAFLENFFSRYVEYDFTAGLEEKLDQVSAGELPWKALMREFWRDFRGAVDDIGELRIGQVIDTLNEKLGPHIFPAREDGADPRKCQACSEGTLSLRLGKFGAFIGCSNYPECKYTRQLAPAEEAPDAIPASGKVLGVDPVSGEMVSLRSGRFGHYVQLGEAEKPKRASIPKAWPLEAIDLERALKLLALPREVGVHPSENEVILAGLGRYGPYLQMGKLYANLPSVEDALEIQMNRAVALIDEKKAGGPRGRFGRAPAAALKELGESPVTGKPLRIMNGRYGAYVADGVTNATLPRGREPSEVTVEEALALLAKRAEQGPSKKKPPQRSKAKKEAAPAKKAPAARKAATKKPPAKKAAPKKKGA